MHDLGILNELYREAADAAVLASSCWNKGSNCACITSEKRAENRHSRIMNKENAASPLMNGIC